MSHFINPIFVHDYIDEEDQRSAQGCFQGSDYWEPERDTDKALKEEWNTRIHIRNINMSLSSLRESLSKCSPHHYNKKKRLEGKIRILTEELNMLTDVNCVK